MNIQIFGKSKCFDTKKAERYFKERRIPYQRIDLLQHGISPGELRAVSRALGGLDALIDSKAKNFFSSGVSYLAYESDREQKLLDDPSLLKTPIVRNGKQATIGFCPEIWKTWE